MPKTNKPSTQRPLKHITSIYVTEQQLDTLKARALVEETSVADIVRRAIRHYLAYVAGSNQNAS